MNRLAAAALAVWLLSAGAFAQDVDSHALSALHWRLLGSFRAGRVSAVAGVPGDPNIYYFGTPGGGIWKTTDAGRVWKPIFDQARVASVGALAVAPSDPNILYAGTGEQTEGNGVWKSTDAGRTWTHAGLDNTRFIQAVIVDPHNPDVLVAGANSIGMYVISPPIVSSPPTFSTPRGVFKSTDGGRTWKQTLSRDDSAGVFDLVADPANPDILYASVLIPSRGVHPSEDVDLAPKDNSEIYKSTDEGSTWTLMPARGLPPNNRGRLGISVAAGTRGRRLYAVLNQGFYRSDDAGVTWYQSTKDPRIVGSTYFSRIFADTRNPDILYVAQTSLYRSTDGGRTFISFVGAPSGDDFHVLWVDPRNPSRLLLGVDQGAIVSVDAGRTWSSWYNQPTGQFYHIGSDNAFPYRTYAAQQDSGTQSVPIRSDFGEIRPSDVTSVGGFEFCFIAPDPLHSNWIYSGGWYGTVVRFDRKTGQTATVFEKGDKYHVAQMPPLFFSAHHPNTLYFGAQMVLKTTDNGATWTAISPNLTVAPNAPPKPAKSGDPPPAIEALAESPVDASEMWAATTNRLVQVTHDAGAHWQNVTPPGIAPLRDIFYVEPSHFDSAEAFLAIGSSRQAAPAQILRTRDGGATWQPIVAGLPPDVSVRVVREDPIRKGLLFAGTATTVYISFDDGDHWHPLTLNLPATPVTDIDIHGSDLLISTYGRGLWSLDDISPIRQLTPAVLASAVHLFKPIPAVRVRWDTWQDTPLPIETPTAQNPPDGIAIDYWLKSSVSAPASITIRDAAGNIVRQYTGQTPQPNLPPANVPEYWFEPSPWVQGSAGLHRFIWDLRYDAPDALPASYFGPILQYTEYTLADHAIPHQTPRVQPQGPLVAPGDYTVELSAAGQTLTQPLHVVIDPRVTASQADLQAQLAEARRLVGGMNLSYGLYHSVDAIAREIKGRQKAHPDDASAIDGIQKQIHALQQGTHDAPGLGPVNRDLSRLLDSIESGDQGPTAPQLQAVKETCSSLEKALTLWNSFNNGLRSHNPLGLPIAPAAPPEGCRQ